MECNKQLKTHGLEAKHRRRAASTKHPVYPPQATTERVVNWKGIEVILDTYESLFVQQWENVCHLW
jgi:hypothetical protein